MKRILSLPCRVCDCRISLSQKEYKLILPEEHYCCSTSCIREHFESLENQFKDRSDLIPSKLPHPLDYYSDVCRKFFRSQWDLIIGEWLYAQWIHFSYEYYVFPVGTKTYTPDFFVYKYGVFLEGKGVWSMGGQKKFKDFRKFYPHVPILLIPYLPPLVREMKRETKEMLNGI